MICNPQSVKVFKACSAHLPRRHRHPPTPRGNTNSSFHVGPALRTSEGHIITAGNVENVVYGSTMCAERAAIFRAVAEGYTRFDASLPCRSASFYPARSVRRTGPPND